MMLRPKDLCHGSGTKTFLEAMESGKVHLARFVLDALDGRIINSKAEGGRTLLMHAVCIQDNATRSKFTHLLLEKGADVNVSDDQGRTALSLACELGYLDAVKLLVQFNADPELIDTWGNSALMYAACGGHDHVLEFLVRAFKTLGLRLDRTNHAGHSAVQVADFFGHNQCVQALSGCRKKAVSPTDSSGEPAEDLRWPNRLPKQVLEKFSRAKAHSKKEEAFPALFQRQLRVGESNSLRIRFRRPPPSSTETMVTNHCQALNNMSERRLAEDKQELLFTSKQIHNSVLKEAGGGRRMDFSSERCPPVKPDEDEAPLWGKSKSFNLDLKSSRKQSYQGDDPDMGRSASRFKRASLQDEKPLVAKFYSQIKANKKERSEAPETPHNDNVKCRRDVSKLGRRNKLLLGRGELEPERLKGESSGGLGGLGSRLLRRFTAPEFLRHIRESDAGQNKGKMSRSETFPLTRTHQRVNSQPSVDSISAVRCEFLK
ncbi:Ankyrin repeat domain-containing protein 63 [Triplophysa tibetana]|uniref:Ankyrin repeat domain-containing protein 63 n=1 Tax=Triplophysa tibetana TaxID=1572043 RepID=A0A5A9NTU4_9TELE|nr:Ankyrin repeat domain-containing protein 63 [Triplophysa tibetana]